jgi:hypothetical protein
MPIVDGVYTSKTEISGFGVLYIPQVNLNGTSKASLKAELQNADAALQLAVDALREMTVHGRDWQSVPNGIEEWGQARDEHRARIAKIIEVRGELTAIWMAINAQGI